jgi:hypothetical protein
MIDPRFLMLGNRFLIFQQTLYHFQAIERNRSDECTLAIQDLQIGIEPFSKKQIYYLMVSIPCGPI